MNEWGQTPFVPIYLLFIPIIPPIAPASILPTIIIIEYKLIEKSLSTILDSKYIKTIYINPINAPFTIPFFFILVILKLLPISILTAVIIIITVGIAVSGTPVLLSIIANIISATIVIIIDTKLPFAIIFMLFFS